MAETRTNRRLAAILAADVVGYSRLMAADETGTLTALRAHRETVFNPAVANHNGRIVKLMGDGTLVEFASVVDAVNCAVAVQSAPPPEAARDIVLRIGINLGDVIIDGDDLYGDGVNIAARLEPLAAPGGICVSAIVNESAGNRIAVQFDDAGEVTVKNIARPIRIWTWQAYAASAPGESEAAAPAAPASPASPAASASIAVLPFDNMSGDPAEDYFCDGITEDIITDLSKVAGLAVIARNSSFAYKGQPVDIRTVGRELGVGAVLEGSIRRAGNRVRITAQLIEVESGSHLWAERYDRDLTDIFAVQDEVTEKIVGALKVTLTPSEKAIISATGTDDISAHDYYLRGREALFTFHKTRESFQAASRLFDQALTRDPDYGAAYAGLSMAHLFDYNNGWSGDPDRALAEGERLAAIAVAKSPDEPFGHYVGAIAASFRRDNARALAGVERALALNPNYGLGLNLRGVIAVYDGRPAEGIPDIERAMRLDPVASQQFLHFLGLAYLLQEKFETAAMLFRERIVLVPETDTSRVFLAAALAGLGAIEEARTVWQELMRINPDYSLTDHLARIPFSDPATPASVAAWLGQAGLPPEVEDG